MEVSIFNHSTHSGSQMDDADDDSHMGSVDDQVSVDSTEPSLTHLSNGSANTSMTGASTGRQKSWAFRPNFAANKARLRRRYLEEAVLQAHVLESLSDGILVFDEQLSILSCNTAAAEMLGFRTPDMVQKEFATFDALMQPIWPASMADSEHARKGMFDPARATLPASSLPSHSKQPQLREILSLSRTSTSVRIEALFRRASACDEQFCDVDLAIGSFRFDGNDYYSATFRDLRQSKLFEQKDTLMAFLSHEIRNPVQAIVSGTQMLCEANPSEIADDIFAAADLLHAVVSDTIDYVQICSRKFEPKTKAFNVSDVLRSCYRVYMGRCPASVERVPPDVSPGVPAIVVADANRFSQIVGNLLSNSSKFTEKGYIRTVVTSEPCAPHLADLGFDGVLQVTVEDTGCGIPEYEHHKLFKFFTQIQADRPNKGLSTGLGLVLSRDIAQALNGDLVLLDSVPGKGTRLRVTLPFQLPAGPVQREPAQPQVATSSSGSIPGAAFVDQSSKASESHVTAQQPVPSAAVNPSSSPEQLEKQRMLSCLNVLVTEDNPIVLSCIKRILTKVGVRAHFATNGREAVETVRSQLTSEFPINLVFMDCHMPIMDGFTATAILRREGFQGPMLAITGSSTASDVERILEAGCNDILIKPVRNDDLVDKIMFYSRSVQAYAAQKKA